MNAGRQLQQPGDSIAVDILTAQDGPSQLQRATWQASAFEHLSAAGAILDASGRIVATNAAWRLFGALNDGVQGAVGEGVSYLEVCSRAAAKGAEPAQSVLAGLKEILSSERTSFDIEYPCPSPNQDRWFILQARAAPILHGAGIVLFHVDITARKILEEGLARRANHDALTGLGNSSAARKAVGSGQGLVSVIAFDLDGFKAVNDTYGHHVGDEVLVQVANRARRVVGEDGSVFRLGGDEFLAVCPDATEDDAERFAGALRVQIGVPFQVGAVAVTIGVSAGVASSADRSSIDVLLAEADARMYQDKHANRGADAGTRSAVAAPVRRPTGPASSVLLPDAELRAVQATTNAVLAHATDLVLFFDGEGAILWASPASERLFGLGPEELVGRSGFDLVHPDDRDRVFSDFLRIPGRGDSVRTDFRVEVADGSLRWVEEIATNLLEDPDVGAVVGHIRDISERVEQRAQIEQDRQRLADAQSLAGLGSFEIDLRAGEVTRSDELWRIIGREPASADLGLLAAVHEDDLPAVRAVLDSIVDGSESASVTHRVVRPDGEIRWVISQASRAKSGPDRLMGTVLDITERHLAELALAHQANHDPLTGLANRRLFVERLEASVERNETTGRRTALLYIDLDDFKAVNDRIGHAGGDTILRAVGGLIDGVLMGGDIVARLGGDEFVVCCEGVVDTDEALKIVSRIRAALLAPFRFGSETFTVSASMGAAMSQPGSQAEMLIREADAAMYVAKQRHSGVEVFDDAMHQQAIRRRGLVAELKAAIAGGQIHTWLQPEVDLASGRLTGFEALARWVHPERGLVSPGDFIELAETSGLINDLGRQVLADACRELARWIDHHPDRHLTVAINLSPVQMANPDLADDVRAAIAAAGVPPGRVCLEVTETALMVAELASEVLRALKEVGVLIAIDDFGTGYSSLSRLKALPVDFLKIDRSFVAGLGCDPEDELIVAAVTNLAHSMGIQVIAEGIETKRQLNMLGAMGCEFGQGFLWSKALPAADTFAYVANAGSWLCSEVSPAPDSGTLSALPGSGRTATESVAMLVHDLASPMSVSLGYAGLLQDLPELAAQPELKAAIEGIVRANQDMASIIGSLADVRPLEEGTIALERCVVDIVPLLAEIAEDSRDLGGFAVSLGGVPSAAVFVDPIRVRQIFRNLLVNAQASQTNHTWIEVADNGARRLVTVSVIDDGPGVPTNRVGDLFTARGGSGLGLYISRSLARAHGGDISYHRTEQGGSEFAVDLPPAATLAAHPSGDVLSPAGRDSEGTQRDADADVRDAAGTDRDDVAYRRDQLAGQRDQLGRERDDDLDQRDRSSKTRDGVSAGRDHAGVQRDRAGGARDDAAEQRDRTAGELEVHDRLGHPQVKLRSQEARRHAASDRRAASEDRNASAKERTEAESDRSAAMADRIAGTLQRATAEADRRFASFDREAGASERAEAQLDRASSHVDRDASAVDRDHASVDSLTGVARRGAGFLALDRDITRARHTGKPLVVGFIDVDQLKAINDSQGHAAGDRLLVYLVNTLQAHLRASDLLFRYGGDEFVCALPEADIGHGEALLLLVNQNLASASAPASITFGFAELRPEDSSAALVARADAALYRNREHVARPPVTTPSQHRPHRSRGGLLQTWGDAANASAHLTEEFELSADVLAGMFRLAPDMLAIASFDGKFLAVNAAWEATLGWEESELLGEPFLALVHPDDVEKTVAESTAMDERGSAKFTNRYRCRDGSYRWLEWVSEPRPAEGLIYAIARDITDRVDAETAVRVTKRRYQLIIESLPDAVVVLADADRRCIYLAGGALAKAGVRIEDHIGQDLNDIYGGYGEGRQALLDAHVVAAAGTSSSFDMTSAISGEYYHVSVVPLLGDSGPGCSMLVASNVSERHQREHQLAVASEQLRQTIEHSPIGMAIVGLDGCFVSVNAALCNIVGYAEEVLTALTFQDITHPDDLDLDLAYLKELLDGAIPAYRMDKRYFHADGSVVWIQLSASPGCSTGPSSTTTSRCSATPPGLAIAAPWCSSTSIASRK